ncbi:DUF4190 domain-containing protein [Nocardioides sp.]|uniref:DUF4190 domain-containing protein n=1 Tax=Nocardioides sp. TaxID=35761 RepID=UPI0039E5E17F
MSEQEPPPNPTPEEKPEGWRPQEWQPRWQPQYEPVESAEPTGDAAAPSNPYTPPQPPRPEPTQPYPQQGYQQPYTGWTQPNPQQPYQQPGPQWQPGYPAYGVPDDSGAQASMIIGVVSLALAFFCVGVGLIGSPFAMILGLRSKRRIDAAAGALGGRGNAQAGFLLGLIGTILLVLAVLAVIAFIVLLASVDDWSTYDGDTSYGNA